MPHLPDFEAWAIFAKVAEKGSFSHAAAELGLAKTTVSKAVSRLEERMRTTLLHRTTRKLSLTESGRQSLERAKRILADGAAIEADILEEAAIPRGVVRMACTSGFGTAALAPVIPEFLKRYPDVEVELHLTEDRIDLVADGYDIAVQIGGAMDSSLRISRLFSLSRPLVGTPDLVARFGMPKHPNDLIPWPKLIATHVPWGAEWEFTLPGQDPVVIHAEGNFRINNTEAMIPTLLAGVGITLIPEFYVWQQIERGELIELLPEWSTMAGPICVVTPPGRARPARVRVLLEFLRARFAGQPWARGVTA